MGSPQKKNIGQLLESPYARHLPQYPSQTEGYVPNELGGKNWSGQATPSKQQYHGNNYHQNINSNQRRRGNNRYFNAQRGSSGSGGNNIGGSGSGGGGGGGYRNQNSFQNNYNDHPGNRHFSSGNRQQPYHGQKYNRPDGGNQRNDYYHPSMMTDPWKDLLERHNAIKNSAINVPSMTTNDSDHEPNTSSSPEQSALPDDTEHPTTTSETSSTPSIPT